MTRPRRRRRRRDYETMALTAMLLLGGALVVLGLFARPQHPGDVAVTEAIGGVAPAPDGAVGGPDPPAGRTDAVALLEPLLASLPPGVVVEDARLAWPGPELSIRGHVPNLPGRDDALGAWGQGRADRAWFRRLSPTPDDSLLVFEYRVASDRQPPGAAGPPADTAGLARPLHDPGWDSLVVNLASESVRLVTLADRATARWTVAYRGHRSELLRALDTLRGRGLPIRQMWLGPIADPPAGEWEMRLRIGRSAEAAP
jgi:hypothetical protein